jgi:hypothetical protein
MTKYFSFVLMLLPIIDAQSTISAFLPMDDVDYEDRYSPSNPAPVLASLVAMVYKMLNAYEM